MKTYTVSQNVIDNKVSDAKKIIARLRKCASGDNKKNSSKKISEFRKEIYLLERNIYAIEIELCGELISEDKVDEIVSRASSYNHQAI